MVVAVTPVFGHTADFSKRGEHVAVQHFGAEGAVKAFDVGVLGRLAVQDTHQLDVLPLCSLLQRGADELRVVVHA